MSETLIRPAMIDSHFTIGNGHVHCEDYAYHVSSDRYDVAAIADGCSSENDTSTGARFLLHTFLQYEDTDFFTRSDEDRDRKLNMVALQAATSCKNLGIKPGAISATLWAIINSGTYISVIGSGDGVLYVKKKSGVELIINVEHEDDAPYYMWYYLDSNRESAYFTQFKGEYKDTTRIAGGEPTVEYRSIKDDPIFRTWFPTKDIESIFVLSDGIEGLCKPNSTTDVMDLNDAVKLVTNIANPNAGSIVRKLKRVSKKRYHYDDLSMAGMVFK